MRTSNCWHFASLQVPEDAPPKRKVTYVTGTRAAIARTGIMQKLNYWGRFGPQETML